MKPLKNKIIQLMAAICLLSATGKSQENFGEIRGLIKNTDLEAVPYATVKILQGNLLIGGTQTDAEGYYKYKPLSAGSYEVLVIEPGHVTQKINKVTVKPGDATYVDVKLSPNTLEVVTVVANTDYVQSGVDRNICTFRSIDYKELSQLAGYTSGDINKVIPQLVSDVVESPNGGLHFRGGREGASGNYIDGVKTYGETFVPGLAIENITVFTGGVPAMYGDMMSGAVVITTKSYFSGIRDKNIRNSQYRERREEAKRQALAEETERDRQKEIETEKAKEKAQKGEQK